MSFYCNIKDKVPHDQRNHAIYKIKCPGCNGYYIGKTERYLITRTNEHGTKETTVNKLLIDVSMTTLQLLDLHILLLNNFYLILARL